MLGEGEEELLPVDSPDFDGLVIRSSDEGLTIVGEADTADSAGMCSEYS